jgi:hypothetical protein
VNRLLQKKLSLQYLGFADNKGEFNIAMWTHPIYDDKQLQARSISHDKVWEKELGQEYLRLVGRNIYPDVQGKLLTIGYVHVTT